MNINYILFCCTQVLPWGKEIQGSIFLLKVEFFPPPQGGGGSKIILPCWNQRKRELSSSKGPKKKHKTSAEQIPAELVKCWYIILGQLCIDVVLENLSPPPSFSCQGTVPWGSRKKKVLLLMAGPLRGGGGKGPGQ